MTTLIVIAKECVAGRVKTRLHPPFSLQQAAELAAASLDDTLQTVLSLNASRRILYFDGNLLPPGSEHFEVMHQPTGGLDERIGAIFDECEGPSVLIGMDTPQVSTELLAPAFPPSAGNTDAWETDAWFGPAADGGFWALGLAEPDGSLVRGVPMSRENTGALQRSRLIDAGLTVRDLATLTDVDTVAAAREVANLAPRSRFATVLAGFAHAGTNGGAA